MQRSIRIAKLFAKKAAKNTFNKANKSSRFYSTQQQAAAPKQQAPVQPPKPAAQEAPKSSGGFGIFSLLTGILAGTAAATYFDLKPYVKDLEKQYGITILPPAAAATTTPASTKSATAASSNTELSALQQQIASARNHLAAEKESAKQLQARVASLEAERSALKDAHTKQVADLKDQLSRITVSTSSDASAQQQPAEVKTVTIVQDNPADKQEIARLTAELARVEAKALDSIEAVTKDLLDTQHKLNASIETHKKDAAALAQATSEFQALLEEEKKKSEEISKQLLDDQAHKLSTQYNDENTVRIEKLAALTTKVYALQYTYEANMAFLDDSQRLSRVTMAVLAFKQAMAQGIPFKPETQILKDLCKDDDLVNAILSTLPSNLQQNGVKKTSDLLLDFQHISDEAHSASFALHEGLVGWMYAKIASAFTFRESGFVKGETVNAKLARAEYYLKAGNLLKAVEELNTIKGESGKVLQPWLQSANDRLLVNQACEILDAHMSNLRYTILQ